ncbi:MAG: hypothetical protein NTV62_02610 [Candidatus Gribaldobacteria bacterium]|nr:hypothetical protein [Candidatus Gribaldobacteria bacterium]
MPKITILTAFLLIAGVMVSSCGTIFAYTMSSSNYKMELDSANVGGGQSASSLYNQQSTLGEVGTGFLSTSLSRLYAGFQQNYQTATTSSCNNNGICDSPDETINNCSSDCGCNNNLACETSRGEDILNCNFDCGNKATIYSPEGATLLIEKIEIKNISFDSALVSWQTSDLGVCKFVWGTTTDYFGGTVGEEDFWINHTTLISNLYSGSFYHFKVICRGTNNQWAQSKDYKFSTLSIPQEKVVPNVENLSYESKDRGVNLTWKNPTEGEFKEIQIRKSTKFYPQNSNEGELVYQGVDNFFLDQKIDLEQDYYYTVFTVDEAGDYSSGVILRAKLNKAGEKVQPQPPVSEPTKPAPPEVEKLTWNDFEFWQGSKRIEFTAGKLLFKEGLPIKIAIAYKKVPEVLKTILVSLKNDNEYFSFLLKINQEKTHYIATIVPPAVGLYPFDIYVLDYQNQSLKKIQGFMEIGSQRVFLSLLDFGQYFSFPVVGLIVLVILFLIILILRRRLKNKNKK